MTAPPRSRLAEREARAGNGMKVLLVVSKYLPEYSGAGLRLHNIYMRLAENYGVSIGVVCNSVEHPGDRGFTFDGVPVRRISSRLFHDWHRIPWPFVRRVALALKTYTEAIATLKALVRKDYDAIHVAGSSASVAAAVLWARFREIPLIIELVNARASPWQGLRWRPATPQ